MLKQNLDVGLSGLPNPDVQLSTFELWQQKYGITGGAPDTNFVEIQCYCHANLGHSLELVAEIETRNSDTQFVSFRHLKEYHKGAAPEGMLPGLHS